MVNYSICHWKTTEPWRIAMLALLMSMMMVAAPASDLDQRSEEIARQLESRLIAPCCWRAPVSEHYSEAADNIRTTIRDMLAKGSGEKEIIEFYTAQYGDRILSAPPAKGFSLLSWVLPFVALALGGIGLLLFIKSHRRPTVAGASQPADSAKSPADSSDDEERYARMLEKEVRESF